MEIRLGILEEQDQTQFIFYDSISIDEYQKLKKCIVDIFNYSQSLKLLELVIFNERDIHNFIAFTIKDIQEKSIKWNGVTFDDVAFYRLEANRFFLNYLSSFKTFLDHSLTILKRKFGNNSIQASEYKSTISIIYDNNFSYRFFYKLRNYAQHCGLPLWFSHSIKKMNIFAEDQIEILIFFNKNELLNNFDSWGIVKNDIAKFEDKVNFFPYFNETTNCIIDISKKFNELITQEIIDSAKYIRLMTQHLKKENNQVCIFSEIETDKNGHLTNLTIEYFPYDEIDKILN